ncbi:MAG: quinate 5-dehydrogenase [Chloroflexi bacterium]|nr:quinate 5-dehydrogenase [Chloroflexota bacterium]
MKEVVSVSLGSSKRNHEVEADLLGERFRIRRVGVDGDLKKAAEMIAELDGKVSAIGLGGIDLYLVVGSKKYAVRDALKLKKVAKVTPVVDGSGLKDTLERGTVKTLIDDGVPIIGKRALMVSAVDRFGMAEALATNGVRMIYGDLPFGLGIPLVIHSFELFHVLASVIVPIVVRLPFKILYPTGSKQDEAPKDKYAKYYREADIIAGDFLFIRNYMPADMTGKWVLTNTTTAEDVEDMKRRGVELLITTTPVFEGRSFGTNVLEGVFLSILGKRWEDVQPDDYRSLLKELDFKPRVQWLNGDPLGTGAEPGDTDTEGREVADEPVVQSGDLIDET